MDKEYSLPHAWAVVFRLLGIQLFSILHREPQKVTQLSRGINLRLPSILPLAQHRGSQQLVAVLSTHEVRGLEEDGSAVCKGHLLPCLLRGEGSINGSRDICGAGAGEVCDGGGV